MSLAKDCSDLEVVVCSEDEFVWKQFLNI